MRVVGMILAQDHMEVEKEAFRTTSPCLKFHVNMGECEDATSGLLVQGLGTAGFVRA